MIVGPQTNGKKMNNTFKELAAVDTAGQTELKGKFSYLSWAFAVSELCARHPNATWKVRRFKSPHTGHKQPFQITDFGVFVEVSVTVNSVKRTQIHPVLDQRLQPISTPSTFQINTSIQRCLVKAIALHGLGLNLYAGEDVPLYVDPFTPEQWESFTAAIEGSDPILFASLEHSNREAFSAMLDIHLEPHRESKTVTAEKKRIVQLIQDGHKQSDDYAEQLTFCALEDDATGVIELTDELNDAEKYLVWHRLDDQIKSKIKSILNEESK